MNDMHAEEELTNYDLEKLEHRQHTLYVIFHGANAFYDDPKLPWIDVFISDMKDDHQYLCGKFLGEARIPLGSDLALTGVISGKDSFSEYADEFIHYTGTPKLPGARVHLDGVYSRLRFPRPHKIHHCYNFSQAKKPKKKKICIVPVFQYRFRDVDALRLRMFLNYGDGCASGGPPRPDTFSWTPAKSDPTPLTLHVRAEEDLEPAQPMRDYIATSKILGNTNPDNPTDWKQYDTGDALPGINDARKYWEVELSLRKRIKWLTDVGSAIQLNTPGPGNVFPVTAPQGRGDDDPSCGHRSGGPVG
jgi:hypothetical protein